MVAKWLGSLPWLAVTLATLALAACDNGAAPQSPPPALPKVTVAKPVVKQIMEIDDFVGRFEAMDEVEVRARASGYLAGEHFTEGALVKKGDLLYTIDSEPFQAEYDNAAAAVEVASSALTFAKDEFERGETLRETGAVSLSALDERRQAYLTAQADLSGAEARLRLAKINLGYTKILAPIDGRISRSLVAPGNLVQANTTLLTNIVALDPIHFYFDVDERSFLAYARHMEAGTMPSPRQNAVAVKIRLSDERQAEHAGTIDFIDNRLDRDTGTMRARAVVANESLFLTPGLFGRISVPGSDVYQGVLVPDAAVGSDQNRRVVYVLGEGNTVMPRVVRPGPRIDGYRVVREGLSGDETIVVNGLMRVRPGATVDPQTVELPPIAAQD